ncbi:hypothetical protein M441DRAFT_137186 [Trichoderma asperellum CBS 433.97]|uniref:Uncharacterized protein n=2 Tax=Trichoderma asperellum TaxID=101201 RepID=A0A2T3ZAZ4_TRIA4|nr:hypothetical protein M441DRAFT_137186 [Trichoderma asperellum CBS 433.97]PTB41966.1 hypothetical protein M441DRAFT_137186 [Trichoderma asperellum CBS 433.97]
MDNSTSSVINNLKFTIAKQVRSMITILAGFNTAMALILAIIIFRNCYKTTKQNDPTFRLRSSFFHVMDVSEIFPFVLSIGIAIQGIIYIVCQTKGLEGLLILGCTSISQAMLPALFLVPYIQLFFGLETIIQALRPRPFPRISKWAIYACLFLVLIGIVVMYVLTRVIEAPDFCYASLFWFVQTWRLEAAILLTTIAGILVVGAIIIFTRLHQGASIGHVERAAASKMVYYMTLGAILNGLTAPYFFSILTQNPMALTALQLDLNMVSSVASNVSGITFGALYLFLRSRKMQKTGPLGHVELGGPREKTVESWPGSDIFNRQIGQPVSPARIAQSRASTISSAVSEGKRSIDREGTTFHATSGGDAADGSDLINVPLTPVVSRARKDSYSLFPSQRETLDIKPKNTAILPSTTYSPAGSNSNEAMDNQTFDFEDLLPPPTIRVSGAPRHNRDSSLVSGLTVQIGLRVSNLSDVNRLEAPFFFSPEMPFSPNQPNWPLAPGTPTNPTNAAASRLNSMAFNDDRGNDMPHSPIRATVEMKRDYEQDIDEDKPITLSPTVYSPNKPPTPPATAHRRGVGMASTPSTPGAATTDERYSVGTAEWI